MQTNRTNGGRLSLQCESWLDKDKKLDMKMKSDLTHSFSVKQIQIIAVCGSIWAVEIIQKNYSLQHIEKKN